MVSLWEITPLPGTLTQGGRQSGTPVRRPGRRADCQSLFEPGIA